MNTKAIPSAKHYSPGGYQATLLGRKKNLKTEGKKNLGKQAKLSLNTIMMTFLEN